MSGEFVAVIFFLALFGSITAIFVGPGWLKSRERREMQATVRAAIDKGQSLPPELIDAMTKDVAKNLPSRNRDIRRGVIWLAVGVGIAAFGLVNDLSSFNGGWEDHVGNGLLGVAAIPATIGLAYLVLSFFNKTRD